MSSSSSSELLNHTRVTAAGATPDRWLLVLHGIYGAGRNWGTIARRLVDARPEWGVVLVDLRGHGGSRTASFPGPHTVAAAAGDVAALARSLGLPVAAVLGHSFGGKVALLLAREAHEGLRQVWVMDSTPAARVPDGSAWEMLEAVRGLPDRFAARQEAVDGLMAAGYPEGLAQWMAINLEPHDGGYRWRIDFGAMEEMLRSFFDTDAWDVIESPPGAAEVHVVKALESQTLDDAAAARVEAAEATGRVFLHRLPGGHWINTDNPDGVLDLLVTRLP